MSVCFNFLQKLLESHISHLRTKSEQELNRLLSMVVDVDNMYIAMNREENLDTKKPYTYLLKVIVSLKTHRKKMICCNSLQLLRRCILTLDNPVIEGPLGQPPFESPSIQKAVTNLVMYKYAHLSQQEFKTMYELAQFFLHCLRTWDFPAPGNQKCVVSPEESTVYKIAYTRSALLS